MRTEGKRIPYGMITACILALCTLLSGCGVSNVPPADPVTKQSYYFDTVVSLTIYDMQGMSKDAADDVIDGAFAVCSDYERLLSKTVEGSDIWNVNHAKGKPTHVSAETLAVVKKGIEYGDLTGGRFDITVGKAEDLWDFHTDDPHVPDADELAEAVKHVNYENIQITEDDSSTNAAVDTIGISYDNSSDKTSKGGTITMLDPEAEIDLGGIAKGYIADRVCDYLRSQNVTSAILSLGGNIETVGGKPAASGHTSGRELQALESKEDAKADSFLSGTTAGSSSSVNDESANEDTSGVSEITSNASTSGGTINDNSSHNATPNNKKDFAAAARAAAQTNFRIGIETPYSDYSQVSGVVDLQDGTMVTSGVYERYFTVNGKEYHHILDVRTGYPINNDVLSVTIKGSAGHSVDCDALSTTCLILGSKEGKALIESLDGYEAAFILRDGTMVTTPGIQVDPAK